MSHNSDELYSPMRRNSFNEVAAVGEHFVKGMSHPQGEKRGIRDGTVSSGRIGVDTGHVVCSHR